MVTRNDVARHAGVSVAVVSYVINNKDNVKEATRQKVLHAIEELGYNPNLAARSLKTKKTSQFGVLFNSLGNPFETGISLGLENRARQLGQTLIFQTYMPEGEDKLKQIFMGRTDGIILMGQSLKPETINHFTKLGVPVCSITTPADGHPDVACIDIDWYKAMQTLVGHLIGLGHERIGFMTPAPRDRHHVRYAHFLRAMEAAGLPFEKEQLLMATSARLEGAYNAMSERLRTTAGLPFTALVCASDLMGIGVLSACRDAGLSVPNDLSVAGCENIMMASHTTPTLTTIHFPRPESGFQMLDLILERIAGGSRPAHITLDFELCIRQSTGAPKEGTT